MLCRATSDSVCAACGGCACVRACVCVCVCDWLEGGGLHMTGYVYVGGIQAEEWYKLGRR